MILTGKFSFVFGIEKSLYCCILISEISYCNKAKLKCPKMLICITMEANEQTVMVKLLKLYFGIPRY